MDVAVLYLSMQDFISMQVFSEVLGSRYLAAPIDAMNAMLAGTDHWHVIKPCVDEWLVTDYWND